MYRFVEIITTNKKYGGINMNSEEKILKQAEKRVKNKIKELQKERKRLIQQDMDKVKLVLDIIKKRMLLC